MSTRAIVDRMAARIATLEADLAEARPKAEAAERRAEAIRCYRRGGMGHSLSVWDMEETDRAILVACPEVVEPAPAAPPVYRCKCGWEGGGAMVETVDGQDYHSDPRGHTSPGLHLCGPVAMVESAPAPAQRWRCACGWEGTAEAGSIDRASSTHLIVGRVHRSACGPVVPVGAPPELERPSAERQEGGDMLEGGRAGRGSSVGAG